MTDSPHSSLTNDMGVKIGVKTNVADGMRTTLAWLRPGDEVYLMSTWEHGEYVYRPAPAMVPRRSRNAIYAWATVEAVGPVHLSNGAAVARTRQVTLTNGRIMLGTLPHIAITRRIRPEEVAERRRQHAERVARDDAQRAREAEHVRGLREAARTRYAPSAAVLAGLEAYRTILAGTGNAEPAYAVMSAVLMAESGMTVIEANTWIMNSLED